MTQRDDNPASCRYYIDARMKPVRRNILGKRTSWINRATSESTDNTTDTRPQEAIKPTRDTKDTTTGTLAIDNASV